MSADDDRITPLDLDVTYWRKMFEERIALEEEGFAVLLADRDRYRDALALIASRHPDHLSPDHREAVQIAKVALAMKPKEKL